MKNNITRLDKTKDDRHVLELKGRYKKLADDLKDALAYAQERMGTDDEGSCNRDSPEIRLPRWRSKGVEAAAEIAGTSCWRLSRSGRYILSIPGTGQANTRTRAAEAMRERLKSLGYDVYVRYLAD